MADKVGGGRRRGNDNGAIGFGVGQGGGARAQEHNEEQRTDQEALHCRCRREWWGKRLMLLRELESESRRALRDIL